MTSQLMGCSFADPSAAATRRHYRAHAGPARDAGYFNAGLSASINSELRPCNLFTPERHEALYGLALDMTGGK
jgi:hypothetical protein